MEYVIFVPQFLFFIDLRFHDASSMALSVQVDRAPAFVATSCPSEELVAAFRAHVPGLLLLHVLLGTHLSPMGNGPQDDLLP